MNELPHFSDPARLRLELRRLMLLREAGKQPRSRGRSLSRAQRAVVHAKTDGRCHVCGESVDLATFQADHVKNHTSGGASVAENYLPACRTCNGYRWHYLPHELQWILKLGIWAKTQIDKHTPVGSTIAQQFTAYERQREARRRNPRTEISEPVMDDCSQQTSPNHALQRTAPRVTVAAISSSDPSRPSHLSP